MRLYFNGRTITDLKKYLEEKAMLLELEAVATERKISEIIMEEKEIYGAGQFDKGSKEFRKQVEENILKNRCLDNARELMYSKCEQEANEDKL